MDELLKRLLEAEVLTEETKHELKVAIESQLAEAISAARADAMATVTQELNEKWIQERDVLIEALDSKVTEQLAEELNELKSDIERFRDLEAEYAEKLVEAKSTMANDLKKDMGQLIEKIDAFFEIRLATELEELREDFQAVRKQEFGKKVFEAFVTEYKKHYADEDSVEGKLTEAERRLDDALTSLQEAEQKVAKLERDRKLKDVLSPLSGRSKEVMEAILKNVDTPLLEDAYKTYIGRVVKETSVTVTDTTSEKESTVLAEGKETKASGAVKTGDDVQRILEQQEEAREEKSRSDAPASISSTEKARLRRLAGMA